VNAERYLKLMNRRYPTVRITPADVVEYAQGQFQQPSTEDAERWLSRHRRCIEEAMGTVIQNNLDRVFEEAMLMAYPDPVFDRQYKEVDEAIQSASDDYGQKMGLEPCSSAYEEREMLEIVQQMLKQPATFAACVAYPQEFGQPDSSAITHRTKRVHLTCRGGQVRVEIITEDGCEHDPDVLIPGRRRKRANESSPNRS